MNKTLKVLAAAGGLYLAAKGLDNRLETTRYTVSSVKIPSEFDGFKIAQISDVHSDAAPGLVSAVTAEKPDIIVSTGDLVHHMGGYDYSLGLCRKLLKIAPVYAVTGNHDVWRSDYAEFENALSAIGVKTLHNERIPLKRGGGHIYLSGIDDPFAVSNRRINAFLEKAAAPADGADSYNILLFHRANRVNFFREYRFNLILAGHMHGGQARIPHLGGVISPRSSWASSKIFFPKYVGGLYTLGSAVVIVSRGLGNPMVIPRVFNRPELVTVTLRHKFQ